jgi:hypothetical protein
MSGLVARLGQLAALLARVDADEAVSADDARAGLALLDEIGDELDGRLAFHAREKLVALAGPQGGR